MNHKKETGMDTNKDAFELFLDKYFEKRFFQLRYLVLIAVIMTMCGSILLFFLGAYETINPLINFIYTHDIKLVELGLVQSLDIFLFALVMMIFSLGTYDLFVSKIEPAVVDGIRPDWLKFNTIDELKRILTKVIIVILIINFFELILTSGQKLEYNFLIIPIGIILLAAALKLMHDPSTHE